VLNDTLLVSNLNGEDVGEIPQDAPVNGLYQVQAPTFTYEPAEPSAGEVIIFKVAEPPNHEPLTYRWSFGDGITKETTSPTIAHAFSSGGNYDVSLTCILNGTEATGVQTVTVESYTPLGVTAEVGQLHFKGETAEFTILTTDAGKPINATSLEAKLYFNGTLINDLSSAIESVDTGLYRIPYYIPADASPGEYTLLAKAEYYGANGAAVAKFVISPTLTAWNDSTAQITQIQNDVATIMNGITDIKLNLTAINATVTGLITSSKGDILAKIDTSLGTLTTRLDTINATVTRVEGNTEYISTTLGDVKTTLGDTQSTATTTLYAASILSAIAIILAAIILLILRKK
jgi:PKD repeat protein